MNIPIESVQDIGDLVRLLRRSQGLRHDDLGAIAGCSHKYVVDLEKGKETIQTGLMLQLLDEMGLKVMIDLPDSLVNTLKTELKSGSSKIPDDRRGAWLLKIEP
ncbi:helix-turn-helix domain-containing protein [Marinobacterium stanieri]|uniref:Helix-turn-helix domain-containing protein n=1 Tax=Marinobacterium stanieri TaxID=49186 RepID=A0A1N6XKR3_9GAMM|nr:helix-turn-helix domain-containing protein [Marinobacterium stanieri]SIR02903.1 Helix-turn-helix domain-containing protein [Marinobacterium stanieri]